MRTGKIARVIVTMLMLLWYGVGEVRADISVFIDDAITNGTITYTINQETRVITLSVTPNSGYYIKASDIIVEPLVGMNNANARRRVPEIANPIVGKMFVNGKEVSVALYEATYVFTLPEKYAGAYVTATFHSTEGEIWITGSTTSVDYNANGHYILTDDVQASVVANLFSGSQTTAFTGTFEGMAKSDGTFPKISGLSPNPLFATINGGTIKNVILDNVDIRSGTTAGNVGAICCEATGSTRIYNCGVLSGTVYGTNNVGGLVGQINSGSSVRVVNCYNFATVSGGIIMAGIVGNNLGTVGSVRIAMCMMYGNMDGTSPVYAGNHVANVKDFTEYNYWRSKADLTYTTYNDQLAIDKDEYLTRFPFYRHILNTHRELAAFFLFGETGESVNDIASTEVAEIGHWVLKKNVADYPIVEPWETNTHKTTQDIKNNLPSTTDKGAGKLLNSIGNDGYYYQTTSGDEVTRHKLNAMGSSGYLTVNVYINGKNVASPNLPITDMDEANHDYTWGKVVLPFANEFSGWTRDYSEICTGWEITNVGGTTSYSASHYNFADRDSKSKDIYDATNNPYIFAQGGNYIVPYGVTSITINAHFAKAYYLSDATYEVGYDADFNNPTPLGGQVFGGVATPTYHEQQVYTDLATLVEALNNTLNPHDQAIVLVGNFHYRVWNANSVLLNTEKAVTIMSVDEDNNQEPDYGWYMGNTHGRLELPPLRFDFVPIIEMGMSSRVGSKVYPGLGIWHTRGWYEQTETCVSFRSQCEINSSDFTNSSDVKNRWIANSGCFVQIVRAKDNPCIKLSYIQIGGNAYVEELYPGCHSDNARTNTAVPIIVTGGEVKECYMTGYNSGGKLNGDIYFWCAGGKIAKFLGAYLEEPIAVSGTTASMTAKVDHALIGRFFGGGTSSKARIKGNITVTMNNSQVDFYCGGPEFGDMYDGKKVTTYAMGSTFGEYYGAGFGGTSITYYREQQNNEVAFSDEKTIFPLAFDTYYKRLDKKDNYGIGTCYKFEYIYHSNGSKGVARFYTGYAQFSLATTGNVKNELHYCTIKQLPGTNSPTVEAKTGNFYGAGCQGRVNGSVESTLTGCTVNGSVYGGGFKAESNEVQVYTSTQPTYSVFNKVEGIFSEFGQGTANTFTWEQGTAGSSDEANKILFTNEVLTDLGNVTGAITLNIEDGTTVAGSVFGGGNESRSLDKTTVNIKGGSVGTDVYGGGNKANVGGETWVNMTGGTINGNVYGGGRGTLQTDAEGNLTDGGVAATVGSTLVELNKGLGDDDKGCVVKGSIFGCNNLNGTPTGSATVHIYATQHADKTTIADKYGIAAKDESVTSNRDILGYWITQAEKNKVAKETLDAAKAAYNNSSATDEQLTAQIAALQTATETAVSTNTSKYDVIAVYGGGNLAAYKPHGPAATTTNDDYKNTTHVATVIIDGCGLTSIRQVYGGGNAASTPATSVTVNGTYEIEELFGGGNGKDNVSYDGTHTFPNPGANVGYVAYSTDYDPPASSKEERKENFGYGTGKASVNIYGGTIHRVFGGSNTKGNVSETAVTMLEDMSTCKFCVDEAYGGGKSAPMDAEAQLLMSCIPGLTAAYGGAEAADIQGNVVLNITNGTFDRVFGGNNKSGTIKGSITVNVEETGCKPIIIGELYGGGNLAGYSVYGYQNDGTLIESGDAPLYADPQVNVRSFTSIGNIYGGGYGANAIMVGNPTVNINVVNDATSTAQQLETADFAGKTITIDEDEQTEHTVTLPAHEKGKMGAINNVYGGGNAAKVIGNTYVNIGTEATIDFVTKKDGEATPATGVAVQGADIRGNVYGGGNQAEVTGDTHVQIGKKVEP